MVMADPAGHAATEDELRARILADPDLVLGDREVMRALVTANERAMGSNIVDLRGMAMEQLEARLDRLEETHRAVIAAAYENLSGANQIHRAILRMLDPEDFETFLRVLGTEVAGILRVDSLRLVLETAQTGSDPALARLGNVLRVAAPGTVHACMTGARSQSPRRVILRQQIPESHVLHGDAAAHIRSEALMRLDLGEGRLPGMLLMGSEDPHQFKPGQGTDLLAFFCGVFERTMRRWLS